MRYLLVLSLLLIAATVQAQVGLRYREDPKAPSLLLTEAPRPQRSEQPAPKGMPVVDTRASQHNMPVIHPDSSMRSDMMIIRPDTVERRHMKVDGSGELMDQR